MKEELLKYKHYWLVLSGLMMANYILVPLLDWQDTQKQTNIMLSKRFDKTTQLFDTKEILQANAEAIDTKLVEVRKWVFTANTDAEFKLNTQQAIEKVLKKGNCQIQRFSFKGEELINDSTSKWTVESRVKGDILCLTQATRSLESMVPYVTVNKIVANHRGFESDIKEDFNVLFELTMIAEEGVTN